MQLYSTNNRELRADLKEAVFQGLPQDNGLFMPLDLTPLPASFFTDLPLLSFSEIGYRICEHLFQGAIPETDLRGIVEGAINFPAPVVRIAEQMAVLELFHGPSLAFKDFGARFMARLMGYFNREETGNLVILVATSGDTGGAVAAGFYQTPGIEVLILYPSGKVSPLQEKQLTTLGHNISALEIDGTFDDCQALVKQAFLDSGLRTNIRLSSANSINIARLIPQSFYYFEAYKQLGSKGDPVVFSIPSGNFGNLTAGLLAQKLGLPVEQFLAATNANDVVPAYLSSGKYEPRPSTPTLSNAMDVGSPSNFARMKDLYRQLNGRDLSNAETKVEMAKLISGYSYTDRQTEEAMWQIMTHHNYLMDPHGAVGYLALRDYQEKHPITRGIILETAHPSKFLEDVERILSVKVDVPERLAELSELPKIATRMDTNYQPFRDYLMDNY